MRVAWRELREDLVREQERLSELERRVLALDRDELKNVGGEALTEQLELSHRRLEEAETALGDFRCKLEPSLRRRGRVMALVGSGVALTAVIVTAWMAANVMATREVLVERAEARHQLTMGNFEDARLATERLERLVSQNPDHRRVLLDAARARATLALEFGTLDAHRAELLAQRALDAGASADEAAIPRVMALLARSELEQVDRALNATTSAEGPAASELIYLRGRWYLAHERYDEAIRRFEAARLARPGDLRPVLALIECHLRAGNPHLARAVLARSRHRFELESVPWAQLLNARIALELGDSPTDVVDQAAAILAGPAELSPWEAAWARLIRARAAQRRGLFEVVHEALERPEHQVFRRDAELNALTATLALEQREVEVAVATARVAATLPPRLERHQLLLAEALLASGQVEEAEMVLRELPRRSTPLLLLGRTRRIQGRYSEAEEALLAALRLDPGSSDARLELARLAFDQRQLDEALVYLEASPEFVQSSIEARVLLADIHRYQYRFNEAERSLARVLALSPDEVTALTVLGELQLEAGDVDGARRILERALARNAGSQRAEIGLVRASIALGELHRADELMQSFDAEAAPGWNHLLAGELWLARSRPDIALLRLELAVDAMPREPAAQVALGEALLRLDGRDGAIRRARQAFQQALRDRPGMPAAELGMAAVAMAGADVRYARRRLESARAALEIVPDAERLQARLRHLQGRARFEYEGDVDGAQSLFFEAIALDPSAAEPNLSLGLAYEEGAFFARACVAYRDFLRLAGGYDSASRTLARGGVERTCPRDNTRPRSP